MTDLDRSSPFARGTTIHIRPPAASGGRWRATVWRDGIAIAEVDEPNATAMLAGLGQILAAGVIGEAARELAEQSGVIGECPLCGRVGPIGLAPCPCRFPPLGGILPH